MDQQTQCMGILYVDVCNSVRLYEVLGDTEAHRLIHDCLHLLVDITHRHGGTVIRTQGDGVMSVFPTADATYDAATEMQHAHRQGPLAITAGFNYGAVIADEGDVYGDAVNLAARVAALARPSEILLTGETVQSLSSNLRKTLRLFDTTTVRGRRRPVEIYAVQTGPDPQNTYVPSAPPRAAGTPRPAALTLTHEGGVYRMGDRVQSIVIGRDERCDLIISSYFASRRHAVVEK
ncbi:MAG: adenylate/guanylate cyclase domain-containing protein, partial [Inquilinus sp.]|nr:adenylate/guanylate cyclase domain-containing protein [Inquilinus sp.]